MKALIISSVLLFSLRAMSAEYGQSNKAPCFAIKQAQIKVSADSSTSDTKSEGESKASGK